MATEDIQSLLSRTIDAVRAAGALTLRHFDPHPSPGAEIPQHPVTAADREADACLRDLLLRACPGCGWLSEETEDDRQRLAHHRTWIVDPMDGTREFLRGAPEYAVSVALVEGGEPVLGVVYNPPRDELYATVRRGGAFRNGRRIFCTEPKPLTQALLLLSPSAMGRRDLDQLRPAPGRVQAVGSIAYRMARVAAGMADVTFTLRPKNEWDVCAGDLLVAEAGGVMLNWNGRRPGYNRPDPLIRGGLAAGPAPLVRAVLAARRNP